jgi:hypothetical protein
MIELEERELTEGMLLEHEAMRMFVRLMILISVDMGWNRGIGNAARESWIEIQIINRNTQY